MPPRALIHAFAGLLAAVCLGAGAGACASRAPRATVPAPLTSLPATASWRWVAPSALIADANGEDDASASLGVVRAMRLDVEAVLKGEHWTITEADSAQYDATVALLTRTRLVPQERPLPNTNPPLPRCDATRSGGTCSPPPPPRSQTVMIQQSESHSVLVIRRRRDGAMATYAAASADARTAGGAITRKVITMLRTP